MTKTIRELAADLAAGRITSVALTEQMLARAEAHRAQGGHAYVSLDGEQALAEARASDALRAAGLARSPLEGLPISVKDLFDIAGHPTLGGSRLLASAAPATQTAEVVQRLRRVRLEELHGDGLPLARLLRQNGPEIERLLDSRSVLSP